MIVRERTRGSASRRGGTARAASGSGSRKSSSGSASGSRLTNTKPPHVSTRTGREREIVGQAGELLAVGHVDEPAVERVAPAVVRAPDRAVGERAAALGEPPAAVQARVVERVRRAGRRRARRRSTRRRSCTRRSRPAPRPPPPGTRSARPAATAARARARRTRGSCSAPWARSRRAARAWDSAGRVMSESDCSGESEGQRVEFNLADLFECVADAVPDREAAVVRRRPAHLRASSTSARPGSRTCSRRAGVGAGDHVGAATCATRSSTSRRCSRATRLRAVPINVNYRYVADELAYLLDDADLVAVVARRRRAATRVDAASRRGVAAVALRLRRRRPRVRARDRRRVGRARPRPALARRPLRPLHGRHDRHAEGRRVAPGGHLLRRRSAAGTPAVRRSPRPSRSGVGARQPRAAPAAVPARRRHAGPAQFVSLALGPLMHASGQWSALGTLLGGGKVVLYDRAARRHGARARPRRARARRTR